jgi:hypothetical protein
LGGEGWGFDGHFFGLEKYATVLRFIFEWVWKSNGNSNDNCKGNNQSLRPSGFASALRLRSGQSGSACARGFCLVRFAESGGSTLIRKNDGSGKSTPTGEGIASAVSSSATSEGNIFSIHARRRETP